MTRTAAGSDTIKNKNKKILVKTLNFIHTAISFFFSLPADYLYIYTEILNEFNVFFYTYIIIIINHSKVIYIDIF